MVDRLVLVNGLPGSGKTTLATALADRLAAPLVAKDAIKEAVADVVPAAPSRALGAAVMDLGWSLVASIEGTVVFEAWWFRYRDLTHVEAGLTRCGGPAVVEVWCEVDPDLARRRYAARRRHRVHEDARVLTSPLPWAALDAGPLGVGAVVRVATDRPVDLAEVARRVTEAFEPSTGD